MLAGERGGQKTKVTENGLPKDAQMIHLSFEVDRGAIDMFFLSEEGTELTEGASIYSVDLIAPTVTGIRALLSELTMGQEVQRIEHEDRVFLLSRRESWWGKAAIGSQRETTGTLGQQ